MKLFEKDTFLTGIIFGILLPLITYVVLFGVDLLWIEVFQKNLTAQHSYLYLLSFISNLFALRYFFLNARKEKIATGVLLITFFAVILYFKFLG